MKPNNLIIFLGQRFELCKAFGLFGKENLVYQCEFDHRIYTHSKYVKYYFEKLNADVVFIVGNNSIESLDTNGYDNIIIMISQDDIYNQKYTYYRNKYPNCKLVFLWMYGEVMSKPLLENCKKANLDLFLCASNQVGIEDVAIFDPKLCFKFFYFYIGYYYLNTLSDKIGQSEYDKTQLPIFTYSKAALESSWRGDLLNPLHEKFPNRIYNGNSINDSYDLEFTKYKHFETINDYSYRNYNLVFETIYYGNNAEYFITEKTFKGLFFGNPCFLVAPSELIKEVSKDFYLLNSEFESLDDFVGCDRLESDFISFKEKSKLNRNKITKYVHDYSYIEYFKKLLN
jgi:hypothetical protein